MNPLATSLAAQILLAVLALAAAAIPAQATRTRVAGTLCVLLGLAGVATGALAMAGHTGSISLPLALPTDLPLAGLTLAPTRLGGLFLIVTGAVGAVAGLFGIGYAHGAVASRTGWASFALFLLGMQLVPASGDVVMFLLAWELMALASTVLLLSDHAERAEVRPAALWYAVMTHLSLVLLLAGFAILAAQAGSTSFAAIAAHSIGGTPATTAFVLLTLGFATKAGLVPLHVWLPRAHPEAPSHVSAAMSAAMVKLGGYGLVLVTVQLLPGGPRWQALLLLVLGAVSALYGILQASVNSDLKRLLAYSTTENMGLIVTALGVAALLAEPGSRVGAGPVGSVALVAALLLVVSHAAFKCVLFLGAGAILHATGERDLDRLGGLAQAMPMTAAAFGIAALGAAALPVTSGFVAEWTLLQSILHGSGGTSDTVIALVLPIVIGLVALTAGLALLTFAKAHGIAFLARPRSAGALAAQEVGPTMRAALVIGAVAVLAIGVAPGPVARALASCVGARTSVEVTGLLGLGLPSISALLDPVALVGLAAVLTIPVALVHLRAARAHPRRAVELAWGCGGVRGTARMQYTATSYAEPLVRVFDDALQPRRDLVVTHAEESAHVVREVRFRQRVGDVIGDRIYAPLVTGALAVGRSAARVQNGSIHRYLSFSFVALLLVLLAVAR